MVHTHGLSHIALAGRTSPELRAGRSRHVVSSPQAFLSPMPATPMVTKSKSGTNDTPPVKHHPELMTAHKSR